MTLPRYLPRFQALLKDHAFESIPQQLSVLFEAQRKALDSVLTNTNGQYTWENLVMPLENMANEWHAIIGPLSHLNAVHNTPKIRKTYQLCLPILTNYGLFFAQHPGLYKAFKTLHESPLFAALSESRQKIITDQLLDFKLSGIELDETNKTRFKAIQQELSTLTNQFENHLLDATHAWQKHIEDKMLLTGIPEYILQDAKKLAEKEKKAGWILTLEPPVYQAVVTYADHAALREEIYHAYVTRASDLSPNGTEWDNSAILNDLLKLRHEEAHLLGYDNYAALSLIQKMAETPVQALTFLDNLAKKIKQQSQQEFAALQAFSTEKLGIKTLNPWDVAYASEKKQEAEYHVSQNAFRPYLPHSTVLNGLFTIANKLYGIRFELITEGVETWHSDVLFYAVRDESDAIRGFVYIDLFARSEKRGGAWMDNCLDRMILADGSLQYPVAYLNCNFTKPSGKKNTAQLSHEEVVTLFHEFGHTLHHILTLVDDLDASGINGVEWDAVEMPSQFFEHWCWQKEAIALFSQHVETGEPIPNDMIDKLLQAKNFQSAMHLARQLEFSLFDLRIHTEYDPEKNDFIQNTLNDVRNNITVTPIAPYNRFQHGFSHIFAGGYSAGYYSYLWAEVLSSDAFVAFEKNGIFDKTTGRKFLHTILEVGSSRPIIDAFIAFREQAPSIDALLRHLGISGSI